MSSGAAVNNREKFDMIITFNVIDAVEHNFQFYNQVCSVLNVSIKEENESDIFFCGLDKGRRAIIEQLRNRLESCGIKCDFNIVDSKHKLPLLKLLYLKLSRQSVYWKF